MPGTPREPSPEAEEALAGYDFALPEASIATRPVTPRDRARLLHMRGSALFDRHVYDLPDILRPDDLLVVNDTKVIPARLWARRGAARVEILLHRAEEKGLWRVFARPAKKLRPGDVLSFGEEPGTLAARVESKLEGGEVLLRFEASPEAFREFLFRCGETPLPPYIARPEGATPADREAYQTIYAEREGAVAAPTAGLHFTPELLARLEAKGVEILRVTLHVGAGTFAPVKAERLSEHVMHAEWGEVSPETARRLNAAREAGRRVVAVGTTSLRVLESAADASGVIHPFAGETRLFIRPGYRFRCVGALMTNFHLPRSTLFVLVSALMGRARMLDAYRHAIAQGYRFYSYGDATFLEPDA